MAISKKLKERIKMAVRTPKQAEELIALLDAEIPVKPEVAALTEIADTASATSEECAEKINEIIAALQA